MFRIICLLLCLAALSSLGACGGGDWPEEEETESQPVHDVHVTDPREPGPTTY